MKLLNRGRELILKPRIKYYLPQFYFVLMAILLFSGNRQISLWDQDEAAYAGFAKNMLESGDEVIPDFMWSDVHRKPPLHFWDIALCYRLFGVNEFSVRFPSAFFVLLTYLLVYYAGQQLFGKRTAFLGMVVLSTTFLVPSLAKVSVTDGTLLFFSTLAAFSLLFVLLKRSLPWSYVFWLAFSLGLLTKGPPIAIFCTLFAGMLFIFHPDRRNLVQLHPWFFLPMACLPLFLWGYAAWQRDGGAFIHWMVDWYILKRVAGSVLGQTGPPGSQFLGILFFFIPYCMFLPKALGTAAKSLFSDRSEFFFLAAWFVCGWFIYELTPSKLPTYVVVSHVPLALLIGKQMNELAETGSRPHLLFVFLHFLILVPLFLFFLFSPLALHIPSALQWNIILTALIVLLGLLMAILQYHSSQFIAIVIATNLLFQFAAWLVVLPEADVLKDSSRRVADYLKIHTPKESTVVIANSNGHPPSLPFYLSRHFSAIRECYDVNTLLCLYQDEQPYAFILTDEQHLQFQEKYPGIKFEKISSMLTDRKEKALYYIALNPAARDY